MTALEVLLSRTGIDARNTTAITVSECDRFVAECEWATDDYGDVYLRRLRSTLAETDEPGLCDHCSRKLDSDDDLVSDDRVVTTALGYRVMIAGCDEISPFVCADCAEQWRAEACRLESATFRQKALAWFSGTNRDFAAFLREVAA